MTGMVDELARGQLLDRRRRLEHAAARSRQPQLHDLLEEVDAALTRMDNGSWGLCEYCHDPVEADRLIADPLVRFCLDHLDARQKTALEQDLQLAAQIQKGLLPKRDFACGAWHASYHYEPASLVSGDYCDIVDAGDRGLYFMLGDVSGKGVAAAMLMAHLHAMFRALIPEELPLKCMVERASRVFCESTLPNHYATLICGRARESGEIELCNAGHLAPLIVRGGEVSSLDSTGLPVGMFCNEEFSVSEVSLDAGQCVVLYTDGVSEATCDSGEDYGVERLRKLVGAGHAFTAPELVNACRNDLAAFRGAAQVTDDVTIFALRRLGSPMLPLAE